MPRRTCLEISFVIGRSYSSCRSELPFSVSCYR
jgi:hypothetical protein